MFNKSVSKIRNCSDTAQRKLEQLEKEKDNILNQITVGEQNMIKEFDKMIQIINSRREQLMKQFGKIQENRLSEIEERMREIKSRLDIIDEFNEHCKTLITNGSPCDISC